jgi:hypothetical protein
MRVALKKNGKPVLSTGMRVSSIQVRPTLRHCKPQQRHLHPRLVSFVGYAVRTLNALEGTHSLPYRVCFACQGMP